jgi:hypothetical protein
MFLQPDLSGALFLYFFNPETSGGIREEKNKEKASRNFGRRAEQLPK